MQIFRIAAIPALVLGAPAFAGNLAEPIVEPVITAPAPMPMVSSWTGFYLGAQAGYGDASQSVGDLSGGLGGVHAGYMHDLGRWVLGAELDYDAAEVNGDTTIAGPLEAGEIDAIKRLKVLAGYNLGNGLVYGTLGGFQADFNTPTWGDIDEEGWLIGVGYKHKFTENWIGGVELLHHRADDFGIRGNDLKLNTLTARVSYKF